MTQQIVQTVPRVPLVTSTDSAERNDRTPRADVVRIEKATFSNDRGTWEIRFL